MKRHDSIVPLSRDHHAGLLFCWKLRQGLKKGISAVRMVPYIVYFQEVHLMPHFREEEELLFVDKSDELVAQALAEHAKIFAAITAISSSETITVAQLENLANLVDNHIRFEERTLFPHLEQKFPPQKLQEIGMILEQNHVAVKDDYADEFWV